MTSHNRVLFESTTLTWSLRPLQYLWLQRMQFSGSVCLDVHNKHGLARHSAHTNDWRIGWHFHRNWHRCKTVCKRQIRNAIIKISTTTTISLRLSKSNLWEIFTPDELKSKKYVSSVRRSASLSVSISPVYSEMNVPRGILAMPRTPNPLARSLHSNICMATFEPFWTTRFLHSNLLHPQTSLHSKIIAGSWYLKSLIKRPSELYQFWMEISLHWQLWVVQLWGETKCMHSMSLFYHFYPW